LGRRRGGSEGEPTPRVDRVDRARDERNLGPHHHEPGIDLVGQRRDRLGIRRVDRHTAAELLDTRVSRRGDDLVDFGRARETPRERVLTTSTADE
jgi:hypothetical protein